MTAAGVDARYLVAADGLHSTIRRLLDRGTPGQPGRGSRSPLPRYGLRRHYRVAPWTDLVEVHWAPRAEAYVTPVSDDGTTAQFRLVRKKNGRIDHVDVTVDDRTATVTAMTYIYKDGGSISFQQTYAVVDGNYVIKAQSGKVDLPSYHADVVSSFSNYKLNVQIDQQVFATD